MFCQNCGTKLGDGAKFCPNCGTKAASPAGDSADSVDPAQTQEMVSTADSSAREMLERGKKLTEEMEFDEAVRVLTELIKLDRNNAEAYNARGDAYYLLDGDKAIRDYSRAIELKPDYAEAFWSRGISYYLSKQDNTHALADFNKAIEFRASLEDKLLIQAFVNRGIIYYGQEKYDAAFQDCKEALALKPDYSDAYNLQGLLYDATGEQDKAVQSYDKAIEISPKFAVAYYNRGLSYLNREAPWENARQILSDFAKAVELAPDNELFREGLDSVKGYRYVTIKCHSCGEVYSVDRLNLAKDATNCDCPKCNIANAIEQLQITIVFDGDGIDNNVDMADELLAALNTVGGYTVVQQTKADYEADNVKREILGTEDKRPFIFVGKINGELFTKCRWDYNEMGMKYGWAANQAILYVEKARLNEKDVAKFAQLVGAEVAEAAPEKPKSFLQKGLDNIKKGVDGATKTVDKLPLAAKIAVGVGGTFLFGLGGLAIAGGTYLINGKVNNDKLFADQKKYLVQKFCAEALSDFIGGV
jgi:tetratricopeptide (TPR) repeat protein